MAIDRIPTSGIPQEDPNEEHFTELRSTGETSKTKEATILKQAEIRKREQEVTELDVIHFREEISGLQHLISTIVFEDYGIKDLSPQSFHDKEQELLASPRTHTENFHSEYLRRLRAYWTITINLSSFTLEDSIRHEIAMRSTETAPYHVLNFSHDLVEEMSKAYDSLGPLFSEDRDARNHGNGRILPIR